MQCLDELPRVSSIKVSGNIIELELEQQIEKLPYLGDDHPTVLVAKYAGQVIVAIGRVEEHENIEGPNLWSRIKIRGSCVTFTIWPLEV